MALLYSNRHAFVKGFLKILYFTPIYIIIFSLILAKVLAKLRFFGGKYCDFGGNRRFLGGNKKGAIRESPVHKVLVKINCLIC